MQQLHEQAVLFECQRSPHDRGGRNVRTPVFVATDVHGNLRAGLVLRDATSVEAYRECRRAINVSQATAACA